MQSTDCEVSEGLGVCYFYPEKVSDNAMTNYKCVEIEQGSQGPSDCFPNIGGAVVDSQCCQVSVCWQKILDSHSLAAVLSALLSATEHGLEIFHHLDESVLEFNRLAVRTSNNKADYPIC